MKAVYPIILTPADRGYVVFVPDLNINTEGDDIPDAIAMARDAIGLWGLAEEDAGREIPAGPAKLPPVNRMKLPPWWISTSMLTAEQTICEPCERTAPSQAG